ncbi:MAG: class I SAM-dependent methyltransferase [Gaiellaceae bacterium]|jgi:SAM-dependent methyltransferase
MAFDELKERHAAAWGAAPFEDVVDTIADVHDHLVRELDPQAGEKWLDVGTGTGAVALRAARAGADVTGADLAPVMIETARRLAREEGLEISYDVADAEELPYGNADFDVVSSSFGLIFAPDHEAASRELARVTKPGGRIGLTAWEPTGATADFFALLGKFQPPPPEGAGSPVGWGTEEHATELLESTFDLRFVHGVSHNSAPPEEAWTQMVTGFGPIKMLYASLDDAKREELRTGYLAYLEPYVRDGVADAPGEYLIILGRRK